MSRFFRYDPEKGTVVEVQKSAAQCRPRYPIACEALTVHPEQIGEARDFARSMGVPTDFRGDGSPIMEDARHYKKYRKINGVIDRSGYDV